MKPRAISQTNKINLHCAALREASRPLYLHKVGCFWNKMLPKFSIWPSKPTDGDETWCYSECRATIYNDWWWYRFVNDVLIYRAHNLRYDGHRVIFVCTNGHAPRHTCPRNVSSVLRARPRTSEVKHARLRPPLPPPPPLPVIERIHLVEHLFSLEPKAAFIFHRWMHMCTSHCSFCQAFGRINKLHLMNLNAKQAK